MPPGTRGPSASFTREPLAEGPNLTPALPFPQPFVYRENVRSTPLLLHLGVASLCLCGEAFAQTASSPQSYVSRQPGACAVPALAAQLDAALSVTSLPARSSLLVALKVDSEGHQNGELELLYSEPPFQRSIRAEDCAELEAALVLSLEIHLDEANSAPVALPAGSPVSASPPEPEPAVAPASRKLDPQDLPPSEPTPLFLPSDSAPKPLDPPAGLSAGVSVGFGQGPTVTLAPHLRSFLKLTGHWQLQANVAYHIGGTVSAATDELRFSQTSFFIGCAWARPFSSKLALRLSAGPVLGFHHVQVLSPNEGGVPALNPYAGLGTGVSLFALKGRFSLEWGLEGQLNLLRHSFDSAGVTAWEQPWVAGGTFLSFGLSAPED